MSVQIPTTYFHINKAGRDSPYLCINILPPSHFNIKLIIADPTCGTHRLSILLHILFETFLENVKSFIGDYLDIQTHFLVKVNEGTQNLKRLWLRSYHFLAWKIPRSDTKAYEPWFKLLSPSMATYMASSSKACDLPLRVSSWRNKSPDLKCLNQSLAVRSFITPSPNAWHMRWSDAALISLLWSRKANNAEQDS